jgi:hypothetical protein
MSKQLTLEEIDTIRDVAKNKAGYAEYRADDVQSTTLYHLLLDKEVLARAAFTANEYEGLREGDMAVLLDMLEHQAEYAKDLVEAWSSESAKRYRERYELALADMGYPAYVDVWEDVC